MFERNMYRLWISPESSKELRLTLEADKSPLEKQLGTLLRWFTAVFPGEEQRLLSWDMAKEPQDIFENLNNLRDSPKSLVLQANADCNYVA